MGLASPMDGVETRNVLERQWIIRSTYIQVKFVRGYLSVARCGNSLTTTRNRSFNTVVSSHRAQKPPEA